ncbi:MAG: hypothetical protein LBI69_04390 [Puniceicoccales bacterium]|jgi:hypothetical protein|nr:hypothetical protein [Puniceicoccales bacterium]
MLKSNNSYMNVNSLSSSGIGAPLPSAFKYPQRCVKDDERVMRHLLLGEYISKTDWEGYDGIPGIDMGIEILDHVMESKYFKPECNSAFCETMKSFIKSVKPANELGLLINMCKSVKYMPIDMIQKYPGINNYKFFNYEELLKAIGDKRANVLKVAENKFLEYISREKFVMNDALHKSLMEEFLSFLVEASHQMEYEEHFIVPCGYKDHATYAYICKDSKNGNLWHVQEINSAAECNEFKIQSSYCTLSTFGRHLLLNKDQLDRFLYDRSRPHFSDQFDMDSRNCYNELWKAYAGKSNEIKIENQDFDRELPWDVMPHFYGEYAGNCVLKGTVGCSEVMLLDCLRRNDKTPDGHSALVGDEGEKTKKFQNKIIIGCYEMVAKMGILMSYLEKSKQSPTKDNLRMIEMAMSQMGTKMRKLETTLEKHKMEKIPYLADDFHSRLVEEFSQLRREVEAHLTSSNAKEVLYARADDGAEVDMPMGEKKCNLERSDSAKLSLQSTYAAVTDRACRKFSHLKINPIDFSAIKRGDIDYVTDALYEQLELAKNHEYAQVAAENAMQIIQNIPFDTIDVKSLTVLNCANLLQGMRRCLVIAEENYVAYERFFYDTSRHGINKKKGLQWQLHNAEGNFRQYNLMLAVNAHAIASIMTFRIASEHEKFFDGRCKKLLENSTFGNRQYLDFYGSFSCYAHSKNDGEIMKKVIDYFDAQKGKEVVLDFLREKDDTVISMDKVDIWRENKAVKFFDKLLNTPENTTLPVDQLLKNTNFKETQFISKRDALLMLIADRSTFNIKDKPNSDYCKVNFKFDVNYDQLDDFLKGEVEKKAKIRGFCADYSRYATEDPRNRDAILLHSLFNILKSGFFINIDFFVKKPGVSITYFPDREASFMLPLRNSNTAEQYLIPSEENEIRCHENSGNRMNHENVAALASMACINEDAKVINLIHQLRTHLDICSAYGNLEIPKNEMEKSNYYLMHFFEQMLQHSSRKKSSLLGNTDINLLKRRPIETNAANDYDELIQAVNGLEKDGADRFWNRVPPNQIKVSSMAMVMHYKSLILRNIIAQKKNDKDVYIKISKILKEQMEKIENLENITKPLQDSDGDIKYNIAIMKNECILNMLELNSIDERCEKKLNEWEEKIDVKYFKELAANSYILKSYNALGLPKGCLYAMRDAHRMLENYYASNQNVAREVAESLYGKFFMQEINLAFHPVYNEGSLLFANQDESRVVDLLTLSFVIDGKFMTLDHTSMTNSSDANRLFGSRQVEAHRCDGLLNFNDDEFGNVEIDEKGCVACDLDGDGQKWLYMGMNVPKEMREKCPIPKYFFCDNLNVFINHDGDIRIYENTVPKKLLFATVNEEINGTNTFALKSYRDQDEGCYIMLKDTSSLVEKLPLQKFEKMDYIGVFYNKDGDVQRIFFPMTRDGNGDEVSIVPWNEPNGRVSWRLNSNKNLKLCLGTILPPFDSQGFPLNGNGGKRYNPLNNFENFLCFESTDPGSLGSFKFLFSNGKYFQEVGLSHDYSCGQNAPCGGDDQQFWGMGCVGEVSYFCDPYMLHEKPMVGNTPLGTLRLVQAFQVQGEYERAVQSLQLLSTNGELGDDEIEMFRQIIEWFEKKNGKEQSPQSANLVWRVIGRMLQWNSSSPKVIALMEDLIAKEMGDFLFRLIAIYLSGYKTYSAAVAMSIEEELLLWDQLSLHFEVIINRSMIEIGTSNFYATTNGAIVETSDSDFSKETIETLMANHYTINVHRKVLKNMRREKLDSQESIEKLKKDYRECGGNCDEKKTLKEMFYYAHETSKLNLGFSANFDNNIVNLSEENAENLKQQMDEAKLAEADAIEEAKEIFSIEKDGAKKSIFDPMDGGDIDIKSYKIENDGSDENAGREFNEGLESLRSEMKKGACSQAHKQGDPFLSQEFIHAIDEEKVKEFTGKLKEKSAQLRQQASVFANEMNVLLNANEFSQTFGATKWSRLSIANSIHLIYGYYIGGKRAKALKYITDHHPAFDKKNLSHLISLAESYICAINSVRHISKTKKALDAFVANRNSSTWGEALSLMRAFRSGKLFQINPDNPCEKHEKLIHQFSLILEKMSQIRLRPDQIQKIHFIFDAVQQKGAGASGVLIQQLMGSGKSKALIPALVLMALCLKKKQRSAGKEKSGEINGDSDEVDLYSFGYPVIVSHITQLPAVLKELPSIFSELNITVEYFDLDLRELRKVQGMRDFRKKLKLIMKQRTRVPVFTSRTLMALRTLFRSSQPTNSNDGMYLKEHQKVRALLQKCTGIFDEIHLTANPKEAFIIESTATEEALKMHIEESEIKFVTRFIFDSLPSDLLSACKSNQQSQIAPQKLQASLKDALHIHLDGLSKPNLSQLSENEKEILIAFLVGEFDGKNDSDARVEQAVIDEILQKCGTDEDRRLLLSLRSFAYQLIPRCFPRVFNKDFGYDPKTGEVIPYANSQPTSSKFQNPREVICYTCLAILAGGFSDGAISDFILKLYREAYEAANANTKFKDTSAYKLFERCFQGCYFADGRPLDLAGAVGVCNGNFKIAPNIIGIARRHLESDGGKYCMRALTNAICMEVAIWNPSSFTTPPSTIVEDLFGMNVAMTGTPSNRSAYPLCMALDDAYSPQEGSLGAVCTKFVENIENGNSFIHAIAADDFADSAERPEGGKSGLTASKILNKWKTDIAKSNKNKDNNPIGNCRIFVDSGSFLISQRTRQIIREIAEFIRDEKLDVTHIEWFDEKANAFVIGEVKGILAANGNNFSVKILNDAANQRPSDVGKIFTFLDSAHSTGSDPAMKRDGYGIMTANLHTMNMSSFTQGIMRERKFLDIPGQKMDLIVRDDALAAIDLKPKEDSEFYDGNGQKNMALGIVRHFTNNTTADTIHQRTQAIRTQLNELISQTVEKWLYECAPGKKNDKCNVEKLREYEAVWANFSDFFLQTELFDVSGWKYLRALSSTRDGMLNAFNENVKKLELRLEKMATTLSPERIERMRSDICEIKNRAMASIERIPNDEKSLSSLGGGGEGEMQEVEQELQNEQELEQEQEKEQEKEQELEQTRLNELTLLLSGSENSRQDVPIKPTPLFDNRKIANGVNVYDYFMGNWAHPGNPTSGSSSANVPRDLFTHFSNAANWPNGNKQQKCIYGKFAAFFKKKFFESFFYSKNFLQAAEGETSVFHRSQICADNALIFWDENCENIKCVFVSGNDLSQIKAAIKSGKIKNCYLCTAAGTPHVKYDGELSEKVKNFIEDVRWMSQFFNGDVDGMKENTNKTCEIFQRDINFKSNGEMIHNFLMLRSGNPKKCYRKIQSSKLIRSGKVKSTTLTNALNDIGDSNLSMNKLFNIVTNLNDSKPITVNILKTVIKFGKNIISDNAKRIVIIKKIKIKLENDDEKDQFMQSIITKIGSEDLLNLFLRDDEDSLEILAKICTYFIENKNANALIGNIKDPRMLALLCICACKKQSEIFQNFAKHSAHLKEFLQGKNAMCAKIQRCLFGKKITKPNGTMLKICQEISQEIENEEKRKEIGKPTGRVMNEEEMEVKTTSSERAKLSKCLSIIFAIAAAVAILAAIFLLISSSGVGILAILASFSGMIGAKMLIFTPGIAFMALTWIFYRRTTPCEADIGA